MTTLYKIDNTGAMRMWTIDNTGNCIYISYGLEHGAQIHQEEWIEEGLAGRSLIEQVESRVNSRINRQIDKGYHFNPEDAITNKGKNGISFHAPMLAQRYDRVNLKTLNLDGAMLQRKLDGNRMLVTREDGKLKAYTRNGKIISTMEHILSDLSFLEEGQTIDGEVYLHGMELKDIGSLMRRKQGKTKTLRYHVYDLIEDITYRERYQMLLDAPLGDSIVVEEAWDHHPSKQDSYFRMVREAGYEGLMLRLNTTGYEAGKRSKSLLKIKYRYDDEFLVIGVELSKEGLGKLVMELPDGKTFTSNAPGNHNQKRHVADNPEEYIGRQATVSYSYLTAFGIPFHATVDKYKNEF